MASKTPEWALYSLSYEELTHKKQAHLLAFICIMCDMRTAYWYKSWILSSVVQSDKM